MIPNRQSDVFDSLNFAGVPKIYRRCRQKCPLLRILPFDAKISNGLLLRTASNLLAYAENASTNETVTPVLKTEGCSAENFCERHNGKCDYSEIGSEEKGFEKMKCMKITKYEHVE